MERVREAKFSDCQNLGERQEESCEKPKSMNEDCRGSELTWVRV
jgi:hypothetical protein